MGLKDMSQFFSRDYLQARQRFLGYAQKSGADIDHYQLSAKGPAGMALGTDFAWIGTRSPKRVFIVQSGVHGVEAFAGAAIQCELLNNLPVMPNDTALILVHVLNPFGMAWLRRANESNVDLNRNCLTEGQEYRGAAVGYANLNELINPSSPPGRDIFLVKAVSKVLRHGVKPLRQAVALGQYEYPSGLFYGGSKLEEGPGLYRQWLVDHIRKTEQVTVVDLHTGLGRFGEYQVFLGLPIDGQKERALQRLLHDAMVIDKLESGGYNIIGGISSLFDSVFKSIHPVYLTVEFGTYSLIRVLRALREENRCHFHCRHDIHHPAKQKLKEALYPAAATWRNLVLERGRNLVDRLITPLVPGN